MDIMLKNILFLIESKYQRDTDFEKDFGIARSTVSAWRKGKLKSYRKMQAEIASFFGVSADWIAGNEQKNSPSDESKRLSEIENKIIAIYRKLPEDKKAAFMTIVESLESSQKGK